MTKLEPTRTSSDLTATERLRRMLDERGVKWTPKRGRKRDGTEWYDQFGVYTEAVQEYSLDGFEHPKGKLLVRRGMGYLTPEQAIVATLDNADLTAENAKLRELVEDMLSCIEIQIAFDHTPKKWMYKEFAGRAQELGIEVDE